MKRRLGIQTTCIKEHNSLTALDYIKDAGFDCFFTSTQITEKADVTAIKEKAEKLGLAYEFIHAPYKNVNSMWLEDEFTAPFMQSIFQSIDNACACDIPIIILHSSSTWYPPAITEEGFKRYDTLIEYAVKKGVKVAIENLRVPAYYESLLARYKDNPFVGFCFDCGHEHWTSPDLPHIQRYGERMLCTHIHDNMGKLENYLTVNGDMHLMPFDGNYDFANMMRQLNEKKYQGALTLEVRSMPEGTNAKEFYKTAYERLEIISKM